jgi:hypothetical protein
MSDNEQRALYERLRQSSCEMLGFDAKLSGLQSIHVDTVSSIRLELDALQSRQLSGQSVDIGRLADLCKLLRSLLPATATEMKPDYTHEFDGALETFAKLIENGATAIEARRVHLSEIQVKTLQAEVEALRVTISEKNAVIASLGGSLSAPPAAPARPEQTSPQPPLPRPSPNAPPPASYLQSNIPLHLKPIRR